MNESKKIKKVMEATDLLKGNSVNEDVTITISGLNHCIEDLKNLAIVANNEIKIIQGCIDSVKAQDQERINRMGYTVNLVQEVISRAYSRVDNSLKQMMNYSH